MSKFNAEAMCVKCGAKGANTRYCQGNASAARVGSCERKGEHLHRTCSRCQYDWVDETLDSPNNV